MKRPPPILSLSSAAIARARLSPPPPAANGITMVTGREGQLSAAALPAPNPLSPAPHNEPSARLNDRREMVVTACSSRSGRIDAHSRWGQDDCALCRDGNYAAPF